MQALQAPWGVKNGVRILCSENPLFPPLLSPTVAGVINRAVSDTPAGTLPDTARARFPTTYGRRKRTMTSSRATNGGKTRAAIYARVSKDDGSQETENQLRVLRDECERAGYTLVGEYVDWESGRKGRRERSEFARLFEDAERRRLDLVMFWSLDRFSREGIRKTISYLQRLDHLGVRFRSHTEPYLDTSNELIAHIVLGVTAYYAQLEALRISDRTKAGLERARAQGKVILVFGALVGRGPKVRGAKHLEDASLELGDNRPLHFRDDIVLPRLRLPPAFGTPLVKLYAMLLR